MSALGFYPVKLSERTGQGRFLLIKNTLAVLSHWTEHQWQWGIVGPAIYRIGIEGSSLYLYFYFYLYPYLYPYPYLYFYLPFYLSISVSLYLCNFGSADLPSI